MNQKKTGKPYRSADDETLEVLDENNAPLLLMPRKAATRQNLRLKVVLIVVRNKEGKIYVHQRSHRKSTYGGSWGVSAAGYVKAGESFEDAALRELAEELSVTSVNLTLAAITKPSPATDNSLVALFISNPAQVLIVPDPEEIAGGMFIDRDELEAMLRDLPELIAPSLSWAAQSCDLFNF
ncbi:MAG: NUDIX domain-containing protein [Deltaproteobacteria bacterium]|jgi:isopentenyl-diphosphate delta-isomerase|nr:NUDIX domain-containing protein [Deltaproteobacteria bacterium]